MAWGARRLAAAILLALILQLIVVCHSSATVEPLSTGHDFLKEQRRWAETAASDPDRTVKKNPDIPILAYVTPWNPSGQQLVSDFRGKFDLVAPVWYTVLVSKPTSAQHKYKLSGGPPAAIDSDWAESLQTPAEDGTDRTVKVVPRFYLDAWTQNDFADLLSNTTLWTALADTIVDEVEKRKYDGIVFESVATYLLFEPIREISRRLHALDKTLVVVLPPIRTSHSLTSTSSGAKRKPTKPSKTEDSQNRMILQSLPQLALVADWFSVMTYDMSSAGGRASGLTGADFSDQSPLRMAKRDNLRQPGPNTSPTWITENLEAVIKAVAQASPEDQAKAKGKRKSTMFGDSSDELSDMFGLDGSSDPSNPFNYDDFGVNEDDAEDESAVATSVTAKFLMGLPMYGYRYPIFFIDRSTGQGVPRAPALSEAQGEAADQDRSAVPFLRGPGEALTMDAITATLTRHPNAHLTYDSKASESWFDYTELVPFDMDDDRQQYGVRPGDEIYWRVYMPTRTSMVHRLAALAPQDSKSTDAHKNQAGLSLWEVGQASEMLLVDL